MRVSPQVVVPVLLLACLAAFAVLFLPAGLEDHGPESLVASYDFHSHFFPKFLHGSEELFAGRLPVWNSYEFGGMPFLATTQPAVFYPPKILLFGLLPPHAAHWAFLFLHYVALGGAMLWFLREQKITGVPAFVGAAVWTFSYPMLGSSYHPTRVANLVWMPIIFLLVERMARGRVRASLPWLVLVVALQLTAGYPEFTIDIGLLVAVHAAARWAFKDWKAPPWKTVPWFAGAFIFAALVASVQLLPLAELGLEANRAAVADVHKDQLATISFFEMVLALFAIFPGLALFMFPGLLNRHGWVPAVGLLFGEVMGNGAWLLLRELPGFSIVRFPWVWAFLIPFSVAWLSAVGAASVGEKLKSAKSLTVGAWLLTAAAIAWATFAAVQLYVFRYPELNSALRRGLELNWVVLAPLPEPPWAILARHVGSETGAVLGVLGALALAICALPFLKNRLPGWSLYAVVTVLILAQSAGYPFGAIPAPAHRPSDVGMVQRLHGNQEPVRGRAFSTHDVLYGYNITDRIPSLFGAEVSFVPWRYRRVIEDLEYRPFLDTINWQKLVQARGFLDALNVHYLATSPVLAAHLAPYGVRPIRTADQEMLFENPDAMGEAWVNYAARVIQSEDAARAYVLGPDFNPHSEVVLSEPRATHFPATTPHLITRPSKIRRSSATEVEYDIQLPRPGIFVVSESAYPGWSATVDGQPVEWFRANYVLRAVELDAGSHTVRFEYRPWSIRWGLVLSGLAGVLLIGLFGWNAARRRKQTGAAEAEPA